MTKAGPLMSRGDIDFIEEHVSGFSHKKSDKSISEERSRKEVDDEFYEDEEMLTMEMPRQ